MSGSITDSDACGNDWDNTWIPPTGSGAEPSNLPIVWKSPWKKVDIILVDHSGQKEIISDETGCFVPVKFQYLITNRLRHLQTLIHKIQSLDVKSIQTRDELLEITTKADAHLRASGEIATVLLNELEDIYLKMIQRFPFTCSIAEELFKGHLQIMMIRDESKVYVVGPSTCKSLICNTIDQFNSLISKESISFDEKWKRVAVGYLKTVSFLLQQYPTVSISTKEDAKEVLLEGTKSDVRNAVKELHDIISSVHVERIPIDSLVGKLLLCPEASALFSSILDSQQMAVSWTIDGDSLIVVSKESIPAGIVHQQLIENFVVAGFSSKDNSPSAFTNSEPFRDTVQRNKNALLVVEKESTGFKMASTKFIMRDLLHREHFCNDVVCESVQVGKSHSDIKDLQAKNRTLKHNFHTMKKCYMEALAEIERLKSNSETEIKMKPTMDKLVQQESYTNDVVFQEDVTRDYSEGQPVHHQRQMPVPVLLNKEQSAVHHQGLQQGGSYYRPLFRKPVDMQDFEKMVKDKGLKFDSASWEGKCSYGNMVCLNSRLKDRFRTQDDVIAMEPGNENSNVDTTRDDFTRIISIAMSFMEYKMLQFFCRDCTIFNGNPKYENGQLIRTLLKEEDESAIKEWVQAILIHLETYNTQVVTMEDIKIDELKWTEVKKEVNVISPDIFCFRSYDGKTLTLKADQYEKLQTAKVKCEFVLGLKIQTKGRKGRVLATDPQYNKDDLAVVSTSSRSYDKRGPSNFARSFSSSSSPMALPMSPVSELTFNSNGIIIKVYVGNILNLDVECIVNAANENLSHGGGVADVISRAAGNRFKDESDDYIRQHGQLKATECCTTSAGNLKYKCVIHAVGPRFYQYKDRRKCAEHLEQTIVNCFLEADRNNIKSIALPCISAGIFGVPKEICSQQYGTGAKRYCSTYGKTTSIKEIHFMDKDPGMVRLIQAEFTRHMLVTNNLT